MSNEISFKFYLLSEPDDNYGFWAEDLLSIE